MSYNLPGEKGSCDLFPTPVQTCDNGVGTFRGKFGFCWVRPRYEGCTYKNTTCTLQNKREGLSQNVLEQHIKWAIRITMYLNICLYNHL